MRSFLVLFVSLLLLTACLYKTKKFTVSNETISAPAGWLDYCNRHPTDPGCK